ncbi:MAG TPA: hypothetical protein DDY43_09805 [Synechococcales bacterium UBA10510]|nr:hypothetical protein [Synechococcales bacterium UBA10510]
MIAAGPDRGLFRSRLLHGAAYGRRQQWLLIQAEVWIQGRVWVAGNAWMLSGGWIGGDGA